MNINNTTIMKICFGEGIMGALIKQHTEATREKLREKVSFLITELSYIANCITKYIQ